jgi:hypothetical protein
MPAEKKVAFITGLPSVHRLAERLEAGVSIIEPSESGAPGGVG